MAFIPTKRWWYFYNIRQRKKKKTLQRARQILIHPIDLDRPAVILELAKMGLSQAEIAREMGVSRQRIGQLVKKAELQPEYRVIMSKVRAARFRKKMNNRMRICKWCGYRFFPDKSRTLFCSERCRRKSKLDSRRRAFHKFYNTKHGQQYHAEYRKMLREQMRLDETKKSR